MTESDGAIAPFYEGWRLTNQRLLEAIGAFSPEQLAWRPGSHNWPIWATTAHLAGARVHWLCGVCKEPGAERTATPDPLSDVGWEDDLAHPRSASELIFALESSWEIVQGCLDRWTADMLHEEFLRKHADGRIQAHTRQSVLMRLLTHDSAHCGEISTTLGVHGLEEIDLWRGRGRFVTPAT